LCRGSRLRRAVDPLKIPDSARRRVPSAPRGASRQSVLSFGPVKRSPRATTIASARLPRRGVWLNRGCEIPRAVEELTSRDRDADEEVSLRAAELWERMLTGGLRCLGKDALWLPGDGRSEDGLASMRGVGRRVSSRRRCPRRSRLCGRSCRLAVRRPYRSRVRLRPRRRAARH
jgi:hypothetical protein